MWCVVFFRGRAVLMAAQSPTGNNAPTGARGFLPASRSLTNVTQAMVKANSSENVYSKRRSSNAAFSLATYASVSSLAVAQTVHGTSLIGCHYCYKALRSVGACPTVTPCAPFPSLPSRLSARHGSHSPSLGWLATSPPKSSTTYQSRPTCPSTVTSLIRELRPGRLSSTTLLSSSAWTS